MLPFKPILLMFVLLFLGSVAMSFWLQPDRPGTPSVSEAPDRSMSHSDQHHARSVETPGRPVAATTGRILQSTQNAPIAQQDEPPAPRLESLIASRMALLELIDRQIASGQPHGNTQDSEYGKLELAEKLLAAAEALKLDELPHAVEKPKGSRAGSYRGSRSLTESPWRNSGVYDVMKPDHVATIVQELAASDRFETAIQLLRAIQQRQAAKVLESVAIPDPTLAACLVERLGR